MSDERGIHARSWQFTRVRVVQAALLGVALALGSAATLQLMGSAPAAGAQAQERPAGPGPQPGDRGLGRGFGPQAGQELVARFDADKDGRLDRAERQAARDWLAANPTGRRPGFGRRGGMSAEPAAPGPKVSPADVRVYGSEPLYDSGTLRTIFLRFEGDDWEQELAAFHNTDVEVPATVIVDGQTYRDVGVHFRGASSFMMVPEGRKRSLNLSFDFVHDGQNVGGYRTLNLLNGNSDPTFLRPVLYARIANDYIAAPKANFVRVVINGESWGVYVSAQQYNKDFLRDFFGTDKGARWKVPGSPGGRGGMEYLGDDPAAYKRTYEIKTKDDAKAWADLIRMFRVLNETPPEQLEAALSPLLDIDGALKFLAIEMALVNTDGYWTRASDYSIYQDEKGRFHVIPHDMNEALLAEGGGPGRRRGFGRGRPPGFGPDGPLAPPDGAGPPPDVLRGMPPQGRGGGFGQGGVELDPLVGLDDPSKPLRSKLLAVPALRARYLAYVRDIAERWLDWQKLEPLLAAWQATIEADVKADTRKLYSTEAFESGLRGGPNSLQGFVDRRRAFLLNVTASGTGMR